MKKIIFLQNEGNTLGGVWYVNKSISEKLITLGYDVTIISIRSKHPADILKCDEKIKYKIINNKDDWGVISGIEIKKDFIKFNILSLIKKMLLRIKQKMEMNNDYKKCKQIIKDIDPNYIVASHYQTLKGIPKEYLKKTIHEQHSSMKQFDIDPKNEKILKKYNNKIKFLWLSYKTLKKAENLGFKNNFYIYNPIRIPSEKISNVNNNKKLITIARLAKQKRIDLMIEIVQDIFKNKKYKDWTFEIYGTGEELDVIRNSINNTKQIKLMGVTNNPINELLTASINLNTSFFEGYAMSIIEANEVGVPTITFDFGESVEEQILNKKTGTIIYNDNISMYKRELMNMMDNKDNILINMSLNVKKFNEQFKIDNIIEKWLDLFNEIDGEYQNDTKIM